MFNLRQLSIYFLTSGLAALVNLFTRILYSQWMDFSWAVVCAYSTGMVVNFGLSSIFVFSWYRGGNFLNILLKFILVASIGLVITVATSALALHLFFWLGWFSIKFSELGAHVVGIGTAFFASFVGHALFTYRQTGMIAAVKRRFS